MEDVAAGLASVRARIRESLRKAGRPDDAVTLVAVSKKQPGARIEAALEAGQRVFGENYVQEARARWGPLKERHPDVALHMIGALQSNKADDAVALFDAIQTLDRPKLATALAKAIDKAGRRPRLLVQVNTGLEPQKAGVAPDGLPGLLDHCRGLGLAVDGLMAIPPADEDVAPHAALLAKLARRHGLDAVSIGMSDDFEAAIRFGATLVRVGSAIFGAREGA
ncbi:MAG: YggS family pyridoxal phosphate-dependent enzyme [Geminicoccaceae bacterium]|nr:YggS family pyridoxal phosphate-dependent enzyme [Geminicoccaceae bacterium]